MGEMMGNIAHQWRQPLSAISTATSGILLEKEYGMLKDEVLDELSYS
jgi:signal transduction histidine kinase